MAAFVPPGVVTRTLAVPADRAGVTAVRLLPSEATTTFVAATPPSVTAVAPAKLLPLIVTLWPPPVMPPAGLTALMVGAATYV